MKKGVADKISIDDHLGCFGAFETEDPICMQHCALNLRCAIESDQNARLEILEELVSSEGMALKVQ
jgi:hypothetical protein